MPLARLPSMMGATDIHQVVNVYESLRKELEFLLTNIDGGNLNGALIGTNNIQNLSVTNEKIASLDAGKIVSGGINTGNVAINRGDNYPIIQNGAAVFDEVVSAHEPPYMGAGVSVSGNWYATKNTGWSNCNLYTFKRTGRYVKFLLGIAADSGATTNVSIQDTSSSILWSTTDTHTQANAYTTTVSIDLGVPDGTVKSVYLSLYSSSATLNAYVRVLHKWQEG